MKTLLCFLLSAFCFGVQAQSPSVLLFGGSAFVGPPVSGFTMWLDPSDTTTLFTNYPQTTAAVNGQFVRVVQDKSTVSGGTNYLRFAETANGPVIRTDGVFSTGLLALRNSSGGPNITSNFTTLGITSTNEGCTVFVVGRPNYTARIDEQFPTLWCFPSWGFYLQATTPGKFEFIVPSGANGSFGSIIWTNNFAYAWAVRLTTNKVQCYTGLTKHAESSWGPRVIASPATSQVHMGDVSGAEAFALSWVGDFTEFIVYPTPLTGLQITNVQNYLITKWGAKTAP